MKTKNCWLEAFLISILFTFCTPTKKNKIDSAKTGEAICNASSIVEWTEEEVEVKRRVFTSAKAATIIYYNDTIGANINWNYDVIISNDKQTDPPTDIVISLLEENGYNNFHRLIFTYTLIGLCSPVPHISIDLKNDIGVIKVFDSNNVLVWRFAEIRGRLSTRMDYIYDDMELVDSVLVRL